MEKKKDRKTAVVFVMVYMLIASLMLAGCKGQAGSGAEQDVTVRVGALKGPTSMGILFLTEKVASGATEYPYTFQMVTAADELALMLAKGELDIALVPANLAAVLYQKTDGGVAVIDINTLGVLYLVTGTAPVGSVADLKGRTVYLTGKGTVPEASLRYLLEKSGVAEEDCLLEFKSEPAEVAAILAADPDAVGLLPQPFAAAALFQNDSLRVVVDLNEAWANQEDGTEGMVTGVTVVRRAFLEQHPEAVRAFLEEHVLSTAAINEDPDRGAYLAVEAGIVPGEAVAESAIPMCGIACITGSEMRDMLSAYLEVLERFQPEMVGGEMPGDDFYYMENDV